MISSCFLLTFPNIMLKKFEVEACDINLDTNDNKLYIITYYMLNWYMLENNPINNLFLQIAL